MASKGKYRRPKADQGQGGKAKLRVVPHKADQTYVGQSDTSRTVARGSSVLFDGYESDAEAEV